MKTCKSIILILISLLSLNGSCEYQEGQRFIIQNNSEQEIIISYGSFPISQGSICFRAGAQFEYEDLILERMIPPHSNKNFEETRFGEYLIGHPNDTLYFQVFYRIDVDTMSCEEFDQIFPLKKEWKVTLSDMQAADWTLIFTPE